MMALEWNEWECPHGKSIGRVDPAEEYADGDAIYAECPNCHRDVVVMCAFEPVFYAYKPENWEKHLDDWRKKKEEA